MYLGLDAVFFCISDFKLIIVIFYCLIVVKKIQGSVYSVYL